jgi:UDP-N-acetylglucosamine 2-epimerase (non-hydrolysing)
MVLHLTTSRSSLVRLSPVADALAAKGVPQGMFDPFAPPEQAWHVPSGGPPHTRGFMTSEYRSAHGPERLMATIEDALERFQPVLMMVADDSESTVAGALAASKMGVPVARVSAGLRCNDWGLGDEVARVVLDAVADELYTDGPDATLTLASQGIAEGRIHEVGSTLADSVNRWRGRAAVRAAWNDFGLSPRQYVLATIHRPENLASAENVTKVTRGLVSLAGRHRILLVLHPRTRAAMEPSRQLEALRSAGVVICGPLDHVDFLSLELGAGAVLTDSAGSQEEATVLGIPCFTLRRTTERTLTLTHGTNTLLGDDPDEIANIEVQAQPHREPMPPIPRWDGQAGRRIVTHLLRAAKRREEA